MAQIATLIYTLGIVWLFALERDRKVKTSKALWLPVVWLLINGSRPVTVWLHITPQSSSELYLEGSPIDRAIYLVLIAVAVAVLAQRKTIVTRFLRENPA